MPTAPENDLFQVEFADGSAPVERNAFLVSYPDEQRSTIGADLGVRLDGGRLAADASKGYLSNIKGVYAVGDANADNSTNVPHALYTGKKAAVFLHGKFPSPFSPPPPFPHQSYVLTPHPSIFQDMQLVGIMIFPSSFVVVRGVVESASSGSATGRGVEITIHEGCDAK